MAAIGIFVVFIVGALIVFFVFWAMRQPSRRTLIDIRRVKENKDFEVYELEDINITDMFYDSNVGGEVQIKSKMAGLWKPKQTMMSFKKDDLAVIHSQPKDRSILIYGAYSIFAKEAQQELKKLEEENGLLTKENWELKDENTILKNRLSDQVDNVIDTQSKLHQTLAFGFNPGGKK